MKKAATARVAANFAAPSKKRAIVRERGLKRRAAISTIKEPSRPHRS
jgi:hypothetical protein